VTPEERALAEAVRALDELGIPYMVTGSLATSYHGRPRSTHDADLVIDPTLEQLEELVSRLTGAGFYADMAGAKQALVDRRQFNVIDIESASKIDLIIVKDRPFSREEFGRRQMVDLAMDHPVAIVTREDAILSKLEWAKKSGDSERQLRDAAGVLELNADLDRAYIERWAEQLGVLDAWRVISSRR
jgi:hypothetical protein